MTRKICSFLAPLAILGMFAEVSEARLSNNNRRAVVLEAFYALRPSHDGSCDKTINGNCVSNWNYLYNDPTAYTTMKNYYGCLSSVWTTYNDGSGCANNNAWVSFWANPGSYGYGTFGGGYGSIGRGGQCRYFANLLTWRSGSSGQIFPGYSSMWNYGNGVERNFAYAVPGDILTSNPAFPPHTAIVVEIKTDGLDVIDANWLTDNNTSNREVIGRHLMKFTDINGDRFGLWKGISYYNEPYVP